MNGILKQAQAEKSQERKLLWDEENRLEAIDENGFVSNYWYDAAGERTVKTSGESEQMFVNGIFSGGNTGTANFTAYVNPYIVVSKGGHYTKHIYIGSQRIVSKLGDLDSYGADPRRIEYAGNNVDGALVNYKNKYEASQQTIKDRYAIFEVPYLGIDNDDYVNEQGFCCDDTPQGNSTKAAMQNDNPELFQYYYHSDHLGSTSLITNLDGDIVQHVEYVPFEEVFIEERNNTWNTPYLFNAKELDEETGLYYYGARYYEPRVSIWLSTDPMQEKYPNMSTYAYTAQNPVKFVDVDGFFPILVNGRVSNDSERGSSTYWNTGILSIISTQTGYAQSAFMFVDGDNGFGTNTRLNAGITQGTADAAAVFARLKGSMVDGQITEQLQFVTHSRGSAFGNGYMQGLSAEVQKLAEAEGIGFAYGAENLVEYSVNLAPHQSNWINYANSGTSNVNISHIGDPLSGNDATGNVINVQSIPFRDSGPLTQHSTGSFIPELGFILNTLENNPKLDLLQAIKIAYKNYDASRANGGTSTVTP